MLRGETKGQSIERHHRETRKRREVGGKSSWKFFVLMGKRRKYVLTSYRHYDVGEVGEFQLANWKY